MRWREKNVSKGNRVWRAGAGAGLRHQEKAIRRDIDVRVEIDRNTGDYHSFRRWQLVEDNDHEYPSRQVAVSDLDERHAGLELATSTKNRWKPSNLAALAHKPPTGDFAKIRDAEREQVLNDFLERNDFLVRGNIKRMERSNAIIEIGKLEAVLPREQMIPKGKPARGRPGARLSAASGSRWSWPAAGAVAHLGEFVKKLFELEVPEIEEGLLEIRGAARGRAAAPRFR